MITNGGPPVDRFRIDRLLHESATMHGGEAHSEAEVEAWLDRQRLLHRQQVTPVPLDDLQGWVTDRASGDIRHSSGGFYRIHGVHVECSHGPVREWWQPIISQPEVGILGIAVREINGLLHLLVQAKAEPGNVNGVQISPTVQATRSNYTQVHGGSATAYLDQFHPMPKAGVLSDVLLSEQGSWFLRKRNRNVVVEVADNVQASEGFCWLTLRQLHGLLTRRNVVNMDTRTVLSTLPLPHADPGGEVQRATRHSDQSIRSWINDRRSEYHLAVSPVPLNEVEAHGWSRVDGRLAHQDGRYFSIVGVDVRAARREVASWQQPLLQPVGLGLAGLAVKSIDGVPHALLHARVRPGYLDVLELGPTVQCLPSNYSHLGAENAPEYLDLMQSPVGDRVRFDTVLSEEGGRFRNAENRYLVIDATDLVPDEEPPDYRWVSLRQITQLLQYSNHLNVEARSLVAAWRATAGSRTILGVGL